MRLGSLLFITACTLDPNPGGQFGEEAGARCEAQERTPLLRDEVAPNGITPGDVLDLAEGAHKHSLHWEQLDQDTGVTLTVTYADGAMEWVDYAYVSDGTGPEIALDCEDLVEVEVEVELTTEDGAFAESMDLQIRAGDGGVSLWSALEDLQGTFDPWDHAPAGNDFEEMKAWLEVTFEKAGPAGAVHGQGSGVNGDPNAPDSTAFAENVPIATWGLASE